MLSLAALIVLAGAAPGQWSLHDGTLVSFVFLQQSNLQAWRPDGSPIDSKPIVKNMPLGLVTQLETPLLIAWTKSVKSNPTPPTVRFKLPTTDQLDSTFTQLAKDQKSWLSGRETPKGQPSEQDAAVGVADGPWKVISWVSYDINNRKAHPTKQRGMAFNPVVGGSAPGHAGPFITVDFPPLTSLRNVAVRVVARDRQGKEIPFTGSNSVPENQGVTNYAFQGDINDLARVELQTRPFEWHTIRVTHFHPSVTSSISDSR